MRPVPTAGARAGHGPTNASGWIALGLLAVAGGAIAWTPQLFSDGDTFMHVAAGQRMLATHGVLTTDPFSFTFAGRPWQTHEWLAEVVMALSFQLAGWSGVALLMAAAFGATAGLLGRHVGRWLAGPPLIAVVVICLATLAPSVLARPHLLALPLLEMWLAELLIARSEGRMPDARRLAPLLILWANVHASFVFGLGLAGAFGLDDVVRNRGRGLLRWTGLGAVLALAACVGPHGYETLLFPLRLTSGGALAHVDEWRAMVPATAPAFEVAVLAGIFVLVRTRAQVSTLSLCLLLLLTWMALAHVRHVLIFAVAAPLLVAEPLGAALNPARGAAEALGAGRRGGGANSLLGALCLAAVLALIAIPRLATPLVIADGQTAPVSALAHTPADLRTEPVLNAYPFGGYLIFAGGKPFIDGRTEVYGDAFLQAYGRLEAGDSAAVAATLADPRIRWTLLQPGSALDAAVDRSPGWRKLYADRFAVVRVRGQ